MRVMVFLVLVMVLLAGCAPGTGSTPTVIPAAPTTAPVEPTVISAAPTTAPVESSGGFNESNALTGIQAAADQYTQAYNTNDVELLRQVVDQTNAPFRRLVEERFNIFQSSIFAGATFPELTVEQIEPRDLGFVQAHLTRGGIAYDWLFKEQDGRWVLSEPTERQIGERYEIEHEHFTFHTYEWAEPVNDRLIALMEQAREQVIERLGRAPEGVYNVYIRPIFGIAPPASANAIAWYQSAARPRGDRMEIYAPYSYVFGGYIESDGWEDDLYQTLVHEYTHLVNQRAFMPTAEMRDWMYEGLAEYVSDSPRAGEVSEAVATDQIIPIIDPNGGVNPQDLDHLYLLEANRSLAYGLSYSLVAYIDQELGGLDKLWELAQAIKSTPGTGVARYDGALQTVFGIGYEEFDAGWRAWLRENY